MKGDESALGVAGDLGAAGGPGAAGGRANGALERAAGSPRTRARAETAATPSPMWPPVVPPAAAC